MSRDNTAAAFTEDGYIRDQNCFHEVQYRTIPADINGCGWVAAYNMRHWLGHKVRWEDVCTEMDAMHTLRFPGPTLIRVMRLYLKKYIPDIRESSGRDEAIHAAATSSAGIFRYQEDHVPHFIFFCRADPSADSFRFFNVNDEFEDARMSMYQFAEEHFVRGNVIVFSV